MGIIPLAWLIVKIWAAFIIVGIAIVLVGVPLSAILGLLFERNVPPTRDPNAWRYH